MRYALSSASGLYSMDNLYWLELLVKHCCVFSSNLSSVSTCSDLLICYHADNELLRFSTLLGTFSVQFASKHSSMYICSQSWSGVELTELLIILLAVLMDFVCKLLVHNFWTILLWTEQWVCWFLGCQHIHSTCWSFRFQNHIYPKLPPPPWIFVFVRLLLGEHQAR